MRAFPGVLLALVLSPPPAEACDRAQTVLERDLALGVAVADRIIVGRVRSIDPGGPVTVEVREVVSGEPTAATELTIRGVPAGDMSRMCGGPPLKVGGDFLFLLWSPTAGATSWDVVDRWSGAMPNTPEARKALDRARAEQRSVSPWKIVGELQTRLLAVQEKGEVDLFVLLRNRSTTDFTFSYSNWPEAKQTRCALQFLDAAGKRLPASPSPIPRKDIVEYFTKNPHEYALPIAPGAAHLHRLDRVTTAAPGWGYKESLGFQFYPATAGTWRVSAECVNVSGKTVSTESLTLKL